MLETPLPISHWRTISRVFVMYTEPYPLFDGTCSQNSLRHTLGILSERDELTRSNLKSSESVLKHPKDQKSPTTTRSLLIERTFNFGNVQYYSTNNLQSQNPSTSSR